MELRDIDYRDPTKPPEFGKDVQVKEIAGFIHVEGISFKNEFSEENEDYLVIKHGKTGGLNITLVDTVSPDSQLKEAVIDFAFRNEEDRGVEIGAMFNRFSIKQEGDTVKINGFGQGDTTCFALIYDGGEVRVENVLGKVNGNIDVKNEVDKTYPSGTTFLLMTDGAMETLVSRDFPLILNEKLSSETLYRNVDQQHLNDLHELMGDVFNRQPSRSPEDIDRLMTTCLRPLISFLGDGRRQHSNQIIFDVLKEMRRSDDVTLVILKTTPLEKWAGLDIDDLMPVTAQGVLESYGNKEINSLLAEMIKKEKFGLPFMRLCAITDFYSLDEETQRWFKEKGLAVVDKEIRIDPQPLNKGFGDYICNDLGFAAFRHFNYYGRTWKEIVENINPAGDIKFLGLNKHYKHGVWASVTHTGGSRFALCGPFVVGKNGRGIMAPAAYGASYAFYEGNDLSVDNTLNFKLFTNIDSETSRAFRAWGMYMQYPEIQNEHLQKKCS